jgi:MFS family permease
VRYFARWGELSRPARLYLLHVALLTFSLAVFGLFFNFVILARGFSLEFLGLLNTVSFAAAASLSVPLLWLVARLSLRRTLLISAVFQLAGVLVFALAASPFPLLAAGALTGVAAVLFEISASPFMMRHSDQHTRDHLFSANAAIRIGVAGLGSLLAGQLPAVTASLLAVAPQSAAAYQATLIIATVGLGLALVPLLFVRDEGRKTKDQRPKMGDEGQEADDGRWTREDERRRTKDEGPRTEDEGRGTKGEGPQTAHHRPDTTDQRAETKDELLVIPGRATNGKRKGFGWSLVLGPWSRLVRSLPAEWRDLLRQPVPLLKLLVSPALISIGAALLIPYLNLFFRARFAIGDQALGALFAALGIATGVASLAGPALSARLGKIRAVVLSQALALPFLVVMGGAPWIGIVVGAALVRAALFNMGTPLYDAFAMERTAEAARPTVIGLMNGAASVGYAFAPLVSTWVQANYGFAPIFVATGVCYALAVLAKYWFFVRGAPSPRSTILQG